MYLQLGAVMSAVVLLAACQGDSPARTVTYTNEEALPSCVRLDDEFSERARKAALELLDAELNAPGPEWEMSRASRCEGRILVRNMVGEGIMKRPFFVQMDENFSNKVIQRPE